MLKILSVLFSLMFCACANQRPAPTVEEIVSPQTDTPIVQAGSELKENTADSSARAHVSSQYSDAPTERVSVQIAPSQTPSADGLEKSSTEWTLISEQNGIKTYGETHPTGDIVSFRGEAVLRTSIEKLTAVLNAPELRKEWVDQLAETHTIENKNMLDRIEYIRSKVPWPFQDRDFVFRVQVQVRKSPYSIFIKMNSVDDPREPPHSGVVRGNLEHAYYFLKDVSTPDSIATEVLVEISADPKGSIPAWIVNLTQKSWPNNTLRALEKVSRREGLFVEPEIKQFFRKPADSL